MGVVLRSLILGGAAIACSALFAASAGASPDETIDVYVSCSVYGPHDRMPDFGVKKTHNRYAQVRFYSEPVRMKVLKEEFDKAAAKVTVRPWEEEHRGLWAMEKAYQDSFTELVGVPFAKFIWGDRVGERPASQSAPGKWRPGDLRCGASPDRSQFEPETYNEIRRMHRVQTDWNMDKPVLLDGVEFAADKPATDVDSNGAHIVIEDREPIGPSKETLARALAEQRRVAQNMAKAAAEAAKADAELKAKLTRMLEEARKRCRPSTNGEKGACAQ